MSKKVKVDFTGVEAFQTVEEGQHVVKIAKAEMSTSQGGNEMINVTFEVTKGSDKGGRVFNNYPLVENALWKLKSLLQAIGLKCDGKVQLDLDKLEGKICIIDVTHEEYEGKTRARVADHRRIAATAEDDDDEVDEDELDDEEDEEEEKPAKKSSKKAPAKEEKPAKKKAPMNKPAKDEDEDEEDDEDWDEEDEDEEEEEKSVKKASKKPEKKAPAKKKAAKKPEPEEDDDEEDDDDDWDEE